MSKPPKRIFIRANLSKPEAIAVGRSVVQRLRKHKVEVLFSNALAQVLDESGTSTGAVDVDADLILCLGGDGTLLSTVRALEGKQIPVLGINLGGLGFLTAISSDDLEEALDTVLAGTYRVEERRMLRAETRGAQGDEVVLHALNEIVVDEGSPTRRAVALRMSIDGASVGAFTADGLIVSTATGSTAYSLSAAGPIVHPALPALVATPICAHSLSIRPLVFRETEKVEIESMIGDTTLMVTADGQDAHAVGMGARVQVELSSRSACLAFVGDRPYYEILRTKLNWGGIPKDR